MKCYHRRVTRADILLFAGRDWAAIEEEKARFWVERKRAMTPAAALAAADALRQFARRAKPDWPDDEERAADLEVHVRVGEALRAVPGRRPR